MDLGIILHQDIPFEAPDNGPVIKQWMSQRKWQPLPFRYARSETNVA